MNDDYLFAAAAAWTEIRGGADRFCARAGRGGRQASRWSGTASAEVERLVGGRGDVRRAGNAARVGGEVVKVAGKQLREEVLRRGDGRLCGVDYEGCVWGMNWGDAGSLIGW
jgi:hypothetical protein